MKKICALICALTMVFTLTACNGKTAPAQSKVSSKTVSSATAASGKSADSVHSEAPKIPSKKAIAEKNVGAYTVKGHSYHHKADNMAYTASYPQLSGEIANIDKINEGIKKCALKMINTLGTGTKKSKTTVKVNSDVTYEGKNFISIGFNEYTKLSSKDESKHVLRTVNVNLKTGEFLGATDLIVKNDNFYKALNVAAKEKLSAELAKSVTVADIKAGLDSDAIYFSEKGVGFSVQISKPKSRHLTLTLSFDQAKPYMNKNGIWKNFV